MVALAWVTPVALHLAKLNPLLQQEGLDTGILWRLNAFWIRQKHEAPDP